MNNLFSIFDPVAAFKLNLNWVRSLIVVGVLPVRFWLAPHPCITVVKNTLVFLHKEIKLALGSPCLPGGTHKLLSLFLFILLNNFIGLIPYVFTRSSHLSFTLALALPLWLSLFLRNLLLSTQEWLAHLVPLGTPYVLIPFMVIIELVSNIIRPITLSVRLAANMVAGHLLLALLRGPIPQVRYLVIRVVILFLVLLRALEIAVSFIQAYVFRTLRSLYVAEVNSPKLLF